MAHYEKVEFGKKPNFLASEVGLRLVTGEIGYTKAHVKGTEGVIREVNGKRYAVAGCPVEVGNKTGFLFEDVEIPNDDTATVECSLIVAGHLYQSGVEPLVRDGLPSATREEFAKQGLFFDDSTAITRPTE